MKVFSPSPRKVTAKGLPKCKWESERALDRGNPTSTVESPWPKAADPLKARWGFSGCVDPGGGGCAAGALISWFPSHSGPYSLSRLFNPNVAGSFYHPTHLGHLTASSRIMIFAVSPGMAINHNLYHLSVQYLILQQALFCSATLFM